jgi:hypothetical protein
MKLSLSTIELFDQMLRSQRLDPSSKDFEAVAQAVITAKREMAAARAELIEAEEVSHGD